MSIGERGRVGEGGGREGGWEREEGERGGTEGRNAVWPTGYY